MHVGIRARQRCARRRCLWRKREATRIVTRIRVRLFYMHNRCHWPLKGQAEDEVRGEDIHEHKVEQGQAEARA